MILSVSPDFKSDFIPLTYGFDNVTGVLRQQGEKYLVTGLREFFRGQVVVALQRETFGELLEDRDSGIFVDRAFFGS